VISPLLSNIMLNEFDQWLEAKYLSKQARKGRWYWNHTIKCQRPIASSENRQWLPAVTYCRYADDFVIIVKGHKAHAEVIRDECREFLEGILQLTLIWIKPILPMSMTDLPFLGIGLFESGDREVRCAW
jgi:RNA-directed DNA polymerase